MNKNLLRTRWAALGAAVAVSLGGGAMWMVDAAPADPGVEFVAITPCRLLATRPAPSTVGARSAPLGAAEAWATAVWGTNGNCTVPATATAVSLNVTVLAGTATSNLTVYPADAGRPNTSNLNWRAGDGATPNAVTVGLSATGSIALYNAAGTVQVIVDIVGYYKTEARPAQVVTVAKSGGDFTTVTAAMASITDSSVNKPYLIEVAPGIYTEPAGVDLKSFVDIRGSGVDVTKVTCACASANDPLTGWSGSPGAVLRAKDPVIVTISDITISNTGSGTWGDGVDIVNPMGLGMSNIVLRDLRIDTINATNTAAVYVVSETLTIDGVAAFAYASGFAGSTAAAVVARDGANVTVTDSTFNGANGLTRSAAMYLSGMNISVRGSELLGGGFSNAYGVLAVAGEGFNSVEIADSEVRGATNSVNIALGSGWISGGQLDGPVGGAGTFHCGGVLKFSDLSALSSVCA